MSKELPIETPDGQIIISAERYKELLRSEKELDALHAGGVSDWEWYDASLEDAGLYDDED